MKRDVKHKGQSTIEYAAVIICIAAALLAIQYYIKRAIQGRVREAADSIGEQYAPKHMDSSIIITKTGKTTVTATQKDIGGGKFGLETTAKTEGDTETRSGYEKAGVFETNLFD